MAEGNGSWAGWWGWAPFRSYREAAEVKEGVLLSFRALGLGALWPEPAFRRWVELRFVFFSMRTCHSCSWAPFSAPGPPSAGALAASGLLPGLLRPVLLQGLMLLLALALTPLAARHWCHLLKPWNQGGRSSLAPFQVCVVSTGPRSFCP